MSQLVGDRAVVLGGSIVGTMAAKALSAFYHEVVVVDRDAVLDVKEVRRGAPHAAHAHAFHSRGFLVVTELFPDLLSQLAEAGVPVTDLGLIRWYFNARLLAPAETGLMAIESHRPVIEGILRSEVAALPNVTYRERTEVLGYLTTEDLGRVTGVRLRSVGDGAPETPLEADLVVDVTGRGSRTPAWLAELGYERPTEERSRIDLTYTSRLFRWRPGMFEDTQSINPVSSPRYPRGAFFSRIDRGTCILSLTGVLGERPPTDPKGFLSYARSLPVAEVYDVVHDAEPLTDPVSFGFPASLRRHYEWLSRFPDRLVVLGDAVCSFNPIYGQGMMVGAIQTMVLRDHLAVGSRPDFSKLREDICAVVNDPWSISTDGGGDPPTAPEQAAEAAAAAEFFDRLIDAATRDPELTSAFLRVAGLVAPPATLMSPEVVARVG